MRLSVLFSVTLIFTNFFTNSVLAQIDAREQSYGTVILSLGKVQVASLKDGLGKKPNTTKPGDRLNVKEFISTGTNSYAKIVMSDRNILQIFPNTKLRIDQYTHTVNEKIARLSLFQGKVRAQVENKYDGVRSRFEIKTPSGLATASESQFIIEFDKKEIVTSVTTLRGQTAFQGLDLKSGHLTDAVSVEKNEVATNLLGKTPGTSNKLSPAELQKTLTDGTITKNSLEANTEDFIKKIDRNDFSSLSSIDQGNDNLLSDTAKNIIRRPATVIIIPTQSQQ